MHHHGRKKHEEGAISAASMAHMKSRAWSKTSLHSCALHVLHEHEAIHISTKIAQYYLRTTGAVSEEII
eukprot:3223924-Amphidinium_carterae.2